MLKLGVGLLGYGFMGKAHVNAFKKAGYIFHPFPVETDLIALCGRNTDTLKAEANRYQFKKWTTDWHDLIKDENINIVDNVAANDVHAEPSIMALKAGKHVIVEKPMAMNLSEARKMTQAAKEAEKNGIKSIVAFNYRFVPALRLARQIISEGRLGRIYHFRANYLLDRLSDPETPFFWRLSKDRAGSGALGDLNSHSIDMMRFLLSTEVDSVMAWNHTFTSKRKDSVGRSMDVNVDDASLLWMKLNNGAMATLEASKVATGYKTMWRIEIHGSEGGLGFDLSRGNELNFYDKKDPLRLQGMRNIHVTEKGVHDYADYWWPRGHGLGWEHYHIHLIEHFLRSIANNTNIGPWGATFEDGLRCQEVLEAALRSSEEGKWINILSVRGS